MQLLRLTAVLALAACAGAPASTEDAPLIGGSADSTRAVGAFVSSGRSFCTGTLIAPRVVVTAKHCTENMPADAAFAFGADARAPERVVGIERFVRATPDRGGFIGKGSDVAGVVLAEDVGDIAPIPVAARALDATEIAQRFVAIGYGVQGSGQPRDQRTRGEITLLAVDGAPLPTRYSTVDRFLDAARDHYERELGTFEVEDLTLKYQRKLLAGYEAYLSDGTVQTCHGDSGGPILRTSADGRVEVVAVVSGGPLPGTVSRPTTCDGGNLVGVIGEPARAMLSAL